jgi:sugar-specific transcriptional regulator TrmB
LRRIGEKGFMLSVEDVQTLTFLGLTNLQAKVYLSFLNIGTTTAKTIAKNTDVARQDVYRILAELEKIGLVQKIFSTPTQYTPVTPDNAVDILLERRQREHLNSLDKAKEFCQRYKNKKILPVEDAHFVLIPPKQRYLQKSKELYENTQVCIDVFTTVQRARVDLQIFKDEYKMALKKGVKVRYLVGKTENENENIDTTIRNPFFELKIITVPKQLAPFTIYDQKDLLMVTTEKEQVYQSQTLWTNNPLIVNSLLNYFDLLWLSQTDSLLFEALITVNQIGKKESRLPPLFL